MAMLRPTSEMKDSGTRYLTMIPINWSVRKLKRHLRREEPKNPGTVPVLSLYRDLGIVLKDSRDDNHNVTSENTSNYKYVQVGDFVVNKMKAWQGSVAVSDYEGIVSPAYYVYHFKDNSFIGRYFHYLLRGCYKDEFMSLSGGIRIGQWDLPSTELDNIMVLVPPLTEQQAIADFLDDRCSKIDEIIAEATESIEEYKQLKQAVIFEAVTKGLDKNGPMKDSGVEWIGPISSDREIIKLRYLVTEYKAGPFGSSLITGKLQTTGGILVYTPEHIAKQSTEIQNNLYLPENRRSEMSQFFVKEGDIIFPIVGSLGRAMIINANMPEGIINQRLARFRVDTNKVDANYFLWLFAKSSFYSQFISVNCRGTIIVNLTKSIIFEMPFILPATIEEQKKISSFLDEKIAQIDSLISEKQALIEDLQAYKKSLIYEVVTGKRKVV